MAKPSARDAHPRTPRVPFPDSLPPALRLDWTAWDDELGDVAEAYVESFGEDALETAVAPLAGVLVSRLAGIPLPNHGDGQSEDDPVAARVRLAMRPVCDEEGRPVVHPVLRYLVGRIQRDESTGPEIVSWGTCFDLRSDRGRRVAARVLERAVRRAAASAVTTPRPLAELMVELLDPKPLEAVYDPCFGTGELLAGVARRLADGRRSSDDATGVEAVFGLEHDDDAYVVGLAQVALAGCDPVVSRRDVDMVPVVPHGMTSGIDPLLNPVPVVPGYDPAAGWSVIEDHLEASPRSILAAGVRPELRLNPWDRLDAAFSAIAIRREYTPPPEIWQYTLRGFPDVIRRVLGFYPEFDGFDGVVADLTRTELTRTETPYLRHILESLRPGGRAVVALLDPVRDERRDAVVSENCLEGAIRMPAGPAGLRVGSEVFVLVLRRESRRPPVRLLRLSGNESVGPVGIAERYRGDASHGRAGGIPDAQLTPSDWPVIPNEVRERAATDSLLGRIGALSDADPVIRVHPLGELADMTAGKPYSAWTVRSRGEPKKGSVGVVRVGDVRDAGIRSPAVFVRGSDAAAMDGDRKLGPGDLLLTATGTVGRVAAVPDTSQVRVAGKGTVVIRPRDGVRPRFLRRVLASNAYQEWFSAHARGMTVQHLSIAKLRELPVPVPPSKLQERVVSLVPGHRGDPFAAIVRILTNRHDPVAEWLEESAEVRELQRPEDTGDGAGQLERIAESLRTLRNEIARPGVRSVPELSSWLETMTEPVAALGGLTDVPPGPERLAVLDGVSLQLERIAPPGDPTSPATALAHDVTRRISALAGLERESILGQVALEADIEPNWVTVDTPREVQVGLTNRSPLPLRRVEVSTLPEIGEARASYVPAGSTFDVAVRIPSGAELGVYRFGVYWRATLLDGRRTKGRMRLAVEVRNSRPAGRVREIGTSPYIVGNPIDRKEMLFGREETLAEIGRQLRSDTHANVVLLEGNRRTGKTSILKRLQDPEVLPDWITVNCSLQGGEGHASKAGLPTNAVFRLIARDLGLAAHAAGVRVWLPDMDPPDPGKPFRVAFVKALRQAYSGEGPFETFELFLQEVIEAARPRRLLLMLDEFDKLQEGIDAGVTSPQVPENIRYLLHTYPELSAVLAGSRRIKRLREEYWSALFGFGHRIPVSALPLEDARLLVTRPVDGRLVYVPEARDRVVELCARQPFLIQSLCNRLFESAARSQRRTVTVDDVEAGAGVMTEDNEHFRTLWGYAGSERRRFLLALCAGLGDRTPATLNLLERRLGSDGVHLHRGERLGDDLEFLRELELLELRGTRGGSAYRLAIPLMAAWMERNVDFEDQRRKAVEEFEEADRGDGFWIAEEDER